MSEVQLPSLVIRPIDEEDLEDLRIWKNKCKNAFFSRHEITINEQLEWYRGYLKRRDDYMFAVLSPSGSSIGCMGIRLRTLEMDWDIYNVILGDLGYKGSGLMSKALRDLIHIAQEKYSAPIRLVVLSDNPAVTWYEKNGFVKEKENTGFIGMCYAPKNMQVQ